MIYLELYIDVKLRCICSPLMKACTSPVMRRYVECVCFMIFWFVENTLSDLTIFICFFYREKYKDGLVYGMECRSRVTYLLGNSLPKQKTVCWSYFPIIHPLELPEIFSIDSLVRSNVDFGHHWFSYKSCKL
jgi:hypothetical protein